MADALSRNISEAEVDVFAVHEDIDYKASLKQKDSGVTSLRTSSSSLKLMDIPFDANGTILLCDVST